MPRKTTSEKEGERKEQAYLIAKAREERADWKYVQEGAERDGTSDYLRRLRRMLKHPEKVPKKGSRR